MVGTFSASFVTIVNADQKLSLAHTDTDEFCDSIKLT